MATDAEQDLHSSAQLPAPHPDSTPIAIRFDDKNIPLPGDLTPGWHKATLLLWILVVLALAAIWSASVQLGLATWWLGPRGDRNPLVVQLVPFIAPLLMQVITLLGVRWTPRYGVVAGAIIVVIGVFDLSHVAGLAWLEIAIGVAAILMSLASLTGTYRRAPT